MEIPSGQTGAYASPRRSFLKRMKDASLLRSAVYEEVEADTDATMQAALVVGMVAIASAIGTAGAGAAGAGGANIFSAIVGSIIATFLGWLAWSGITYIIGDKLLGGTATWGEMLRTIGFAQSPRVLVVLAFIPVVGWIVVLAVFVWVLVAGIIAIRQAMDFSTGKAILTAVIGFVVYVALSWLAGMLFGGGGALA